VKGGSWVVVVEDTQGNSARFWGGDEAWHLISEASSTTTALYITVALSIPHLSFSHSTLFLNQLFAYLFLPVGFFDLSDPPLARPSAVNTFQYA
jgi:hypothetical protein